MVTQGRDGYHCLLWALDLCIMQQPVMGVCINLLWVCDLCYTVGRSCVLRGMTVTPVISVPCLLCTVALAGSLAKFC